MFIILNLLRDFSVFFNSLLLVILSNYRQIKNLICYRISFGTMFRKYIYLSTFTTMVSFWMFLTFYLRFLWTLIALFQPYCSCGSRLEVLIWLFMSILIKHVNIQDKGIFIKTTACIKFYYWKFKFFTNNLNILVNSEGKFVMR